MRWGLVACALVSVACGGATPRPSDTWTPIARTAATRLDVEALLARVAKEQLCRQLDGRFVPISIEPPPAGAAAGLVASTGAWWVRSCTPALLGNYLVAFELAGPGWVWADRSESGFSLHDFVFFRAHVTFGGTLDLLAFDPQLDTASIVLHPQGRPVIQAGRVGDVEVHANSIFSAFFEGATLGLLGVYADSAAGDKAEEMLGEAFRRRLSSDVTATLNLRTGQFDFVLGPLASGVAPLRPFADPLPDGDHFVVNERQDLHPGMPRIVGPIEPAAGARVDFAVDGPAVRYRAECRSVIEATFGHPLDLGQPGALPPASPATSGVVSGRSTRSIVMPCHWYLLTEAEAPTHLQIRVHGAAFLGMPAP